MAQLNALYFYFVKVPELAALNTRRLTLLNYRITMRKSSMGRILKTHVKGSYPATSNF